MIVSFFERALKQNGSGLLGLDNFTSDNTQTQVDILVGDSTVREPVLCVASGDAATFDSNELIVIESIYVRLPYQFTFGILNIPVIFVKAGFLADGTPLAPEFMLEIGESGRTFIPVENTEASLSLVVTPPKGSAKWQVWASIDGDTGPGTLPVFVSTVNAPDVFNGAPGVNLPVIVGAKIRHGIPVVGTP